MSSRQKKILLLGAGFTTRNMGVWALASGAITSVLHVYPDAQINLLDYHSRPLSYEVKHPGGTDSVQLINLRFSRKFWLPNNIARLLLTVLLVKMIPSQSFRNRLFTRNFWLRHIQKADIIGSIAGGDSFSDIYGFGRLIYVALPQLLVLLMGKPLVLLPQTIGPFKSPYGRTVARYILKRAWRIYSRDRKGLDKVPAIVASSSVQMYFCYDMGFALEPQIVEERIPRRLVKLDNGIPIVGLNVSGLLYVGGYSGKNMFGLKGDYRQFIHVLIDYLIREHNVHIMLVPHVKGDAKNSESDVIACREIIDNIKEDLQEHLIFIDDGYNHHELKALIGRCDFFLGSRMHACIAALSQCVPAIGLAYSKKFHGVFSSIGMEELVLDLREHDCHYLIENVKRAYNNRKRFRSQLETKMPFVRASVLELFTKIDAECIGAIHQNK